MRRLLSIWLMLPVYGRDPVEDYHAINEGLRLTLQSYAERPQIVVAKQVRLCLAQKDAVGSQKKQLKLMAGLSLPSLR